MNIIISIILIFLSIIVLTFAISVIYEIKIWNNGICKSNGKQWKLVCIDPNGNKTYKAGDKFCNITFSFIDKNN